MRVGGRGAGDCDIDGSVQECCRQWCESENEEGQGEMLWRRGDSEGRRPLRWAPRWAPSRPQVRLECVINQLSFG